MPVIRRTAQAEEDLIDLWLYIAQDNPGAADRLLEEIEDKCSLLADHPQLGPARPDIAVDCRYCRDRNAARTTVDGEFPACTLSVVQRVPSSTMVHVSASPPAIPDGRLSRVRFWPRLCTPFFRNSPSCPLGGLSR